MAKAFASTADTKTQPARLTQLAENVYGYISDYDPNTGFIVGPDSVMVIDCRATPKMAREWIADIRTITDKPITHIFLTHYHAVRVMGRAAFTDAHTVMASRGTLDLIRERGQQDFESEVRRFPRLFDAVEEVPGLTWPNVTFEREMTLWWGDREIRLEHLGRGHSKGDSVVWLPDDRVLFAGDLVEERCALYCGDAYLREWRETLDRVAALNARVVVPGRGSAIIGEENVREAIRLTREFLDDLITLTQEALDKGADLKGAFDHVYAVMTPKYGDWPIYEHCIPFNVSRAYDELRGIQDPIIWTAERDIEMWNALQG
ncbi:MAG: MBL fold metallo-hydrolase [Chloroflexi bacterium]|nr:MBL fold metallo-hydrolase [Chloroflexota bacterium]